MIYTQVYLHTNILVSTIETKIIGRHCICGEQGWIKKYCGLNIKDYGDHYWPPQEQIEAILNKKKYDQLISKNVHYNLLLFSPEIQFVFYFFNLFIFNWRIIALQYCLGFCHTTDSVL